MKGRKKAFDSFLLLITVLSCSLVAAVIAGICIGSVRVSLAAVFRGIFTRAEGTGEFIVRSIRLPRVLGSVLCGAMLGISGVVFQSVFRNPMADPYLLGVSSGSSLAVAVGSLLGITLGFLPSIPLLAFLGALGASAVVLAVSHNSQRTLILSGIALSSLFSALTTLFIYLNRRELSNIIFWNMGSFSSMTMTKVLIMTVILAGCLAFILPRARVLDLLLLDELSARSMGIDIQKNRFRLLLAATVCTAGAVCFCGTIGFAGLLAPHIARLLCGPKHRRLIPATCLTGALILLVSDTLARTILGTSEIPVGVITSILGAPLFISLACKKENTLW